MNVWMEEGYEGKINGGNKSLKTLDFIFNTIYSEETA